MVGFFTGLLKKMKEAKKRQKDKLIGDKLTIADILACDDVNNILSNLDKEKANIAAVEFLQDKMGIVLAKRQTISCNYLRRN